jgi:hypothetical protein
VFVVSWLLLTVLGVIDDFRCSSPLSGEVDEEAVALPFSSTREAESGFLKKPKRDEKETIEGEGVTPALSRGSQACMKGSTAED